MISPWVLFPWTRRGLSMGSMHGRTIDMILSDKIDAGEKFRLGFDIGGTFTDFVLVGEKSGRTYLGKCLTTPQDPSEGVSNGLGPLLENAGIDGRDVAIAIHATT